LFDTTTFILHPCFHLIQNFLQAITLKLYIQFDYSNVFRNLLPCCIFYRLKILTYLSNRFICKKSNEIKRKLNLFSQKFCLNFNRFHTCIISRWNDNKSMLNRMLKCLHTIIKNEFWGSLNQFILRWLLVELLLIKPRLCQLRYLFCHGWLPLIYLVQYILRVHKKNSSYLCCCTSLPSVYPFPKLLLYTVCIYVVKREIWLLKVLEK